MRHYKITIRFTIPIQVSNKIDEYPTLGVSFDYEDGKIQGLNHQFFTQHELNHDERVSHSERQLTLLWELLQYRYGLPIKRESCRSEEVESDGRKTGQVKVALDALISKQVNLPDERILSSPAPRLHAWIRFANDAVAASTDAEAIRLWYALYEDMRCCPTGSNAAAAELKHMRDFVSHGIPLDNPELLNFLATEVGPGTNQYDPTNQRHLAIVKKHRQKARIFVENELEKGLQ